MMIWAFAGLNAAVKGMQGPTAALLQT